MAVNRNTFYSKTRNITVKSWRTVHVAEARLKIKLKHIIKTQTSRPGQKKDGDYVTMLTVQRMIILPNPQHPSMQTGSGFLVGALCTRWTVAGVLVDCWLFCVMPDSLPFADRHGRNSAVRSATCCPRIPFIADHKPSLSSAEFILFVCQCFPSACTHRYCCIALILMQLLHNAAWPFHEIRCQTLI